MASQPQRVPPSAKNGSPTTKYSVSNHTRKHSKRERGLVDRGANGSIAGSDMNTIEITDKYVDLDGVTAHTVRHLQLVTAGAYIESNRGPVIIQIHHAASMHDGKTILSSGQLEAFGCQLFEKSKKFTGEQPHIVTPCGHKLPIAIRDGLAYLHIRPFTTDEFNTLPHICLTSPKPWNPKSIDCGIPDDWCKNQPTDSPLTEANPVDDFGVLKPAIKPVTRRSIKAFTAVGERR